MSCNFTIKNVQLVDHLGSEENILGQIHVTSSQFVFKIDARIGGKEIWVMNSLIGSVERTSPSAAGCRLTIRCKHFLMLVFQIQKDRDCQALFEALQKLGKIVNITDAIAFSKNDLNTNSLWHRLDWKQEFFRQEVTEYWSALEFNFNYTYCDTYPGFYENILQKSKGVDLLWFPCGASLQLLIGSCNFRSKARLPVLTYFHKSNSATICRCAQPLAGFSARCIEDETLIELIMKANQTSSPLYLIDTRPRVNAMVNKVQGKGFEDTRNYTNMQFHFFDIENIHVMRGSLAKLLDACQKPQTITQYLKAVDSSNWLKHLRSLVECGRFIAEAVQRGISCVVHCSDGWDRTAQTVSLAQLILDPYFRTLQGFEILIEKDWLGFGHKFDDRCAHLGISSDEASKEVSPVFTQFIDCVYHLTQQNPSAFEFNERFLITVNEHSYSMAFGNFLGNCDKDRKDIRLSERTQSLWNYIDQNLNSFLNPFYEECALLPSDIDLRPSSYFVWTAMYNRFSFDRFDSGLHPRQYFPDVAQKTKEHEEFLSRLMENDAMVAIKWQSLLNAEECFDSDCQREFDSRLSMRSHCLSCGKIFCDRCFAVNNSVDRVCKKCSI